MRVWNAIGRCATVVCFLAVALQPRPGCADGRVSLQPPAAEVAAVRSPFALNATKAFHVESPGSEGVAQRLGWMKELGVACDRTDLWWHVVEPRPGVYDWRRSDRVFAEFEQAGVEWYPILCYGAAWWKDRTGPREEAEYSQFADYVHRTLSRYRGRARYWSVWNEPNIVNFWSPQPDPDKYAALLRKVREAARRADPDARLCAPVTAPLAGLDRKFIERTFQLGSLNDFDVFDYHYYRNYAPEKEVPEELALIRGLMARYGTVKPIWISETGVTSGVPPETTGTAALTASAGEAASAYSYDRQASYIIRNHLLCLALGVERIFYFDLQNWFDDQPEVWDSTLGLIDAAGRRKPSFYAYQTLVRQTEGKEFLGRCSTLGTATEGVLLRDRSSGELTLAAWTPDEKAPRRLQMRSEKGVLAATSPDGAVTSLTAAQDRPTSALDVEIDHHPRYFRGVSPAPYLADATIQLLPAYTILAPGETRPLQVGLTNAYLDHPTVKITETTVPEGITWDPSGQLRIDGEVRPGKYSLRVAVEVESGPSADRQRLTLVRSAVIEVVPAATVSIRPHRDRNTAPCPDESPEDAHLTSDEILVETVLANHSARELSGTLQLLRSDADSDQSRVLVTSSALAPLRPFETRRLQLKLALASLRSDSAVTSLSASFGPFQSRPFHVTPVPLTEDGSAPKVDGNLGDWPQEWPALELREAGQLTRNSSPGYTPEDCSARVRYWFTPEKLYVAAEISDDEDPRNPNPPLKMWNGDALELYLGLCGPTRRTVLNKNFEYQLGLSPTSDTGKPAAFYFHADVPLAKAQLIVSPTPSGYVMEASIPLAELNTPIPSLEAGGLIALDAAVDDLDGDDWAPAGNTKGRALTWNGTLMNWIDPSGWGLGILVNKENEVSRRNTSKD